MIKILLAFSFFLWSGFGAFGGFNPYGFSQPYYNPGPGYLQPSYSYQQPYGFNRRYAMNRPRPSSSFNPIEIACSAYNCGKESGFKKCLANPQNPYRYFYFNRDVIPTDKGRRAFLKFIDEHPKCYAQFCNRVCSEVPDKFNVEVEEEEAPEGGLMKHAYRLRDRFMQNDAWKGRQYQSRSIIRDRIEEKCKRGDSEAIAIRMWCSECSSYLKTDRQLIKACTIPKLTYKGTRFISKRNGEERYYVKPTMIELNEAVVSPEMQQQSQQNKQTKEVKQTQQEERVDDSGSVLGEDEEDDGSDTSSQASGSSGKSSNSSSSQGSQGSRLTAGNLAQLPQQQPTPIGQWTQQVAQAQRP